jgi:RNA polymerase sigma factor (sigma-70 family)
MRSRGAKTPPAANPASPAVVLRGTIDPMADADPTLSDLFQTHRHGLAGAVRSVLGSAADVTEVLQDAFLKCWRNWQQGTRPRDPTAWIFVVVWNVAVDARRRRQRQPIHETLDEDSAVTPISLPTAARALEQRDDVSAAQAAVAGLSDAEQQVFLLRVGGELTFEAVAHALAIPVGTAKTRMRSALQKLRQTLGATARREESRR